MARKWILNRPLKEKKELRRSHGLAHILKLRQFSCVVRPGWLPAFESFQEYFCRVFLVFLVVVCLKDVVRLLETRGRVSRPVTS